MSIFVLGVGTGSGIAVSESNPRIAEVIDVQTGFVDDTDSPHDAVVHATAKALTASHFQCLRSAIFIKGKSTSYYVLVALQWFIAGHLEAVPASLISSRVIKHPVQMDALVPGDDGNGLGDEDMGGLTPVEFYEKYGRLPYGADEITLEE